jgi:hypothetical protein
MSGSILSCTHVYMEVSESVSRCILCGHEKYYLSKWTIKTARV